MTLEEVLNKYLDFRNSNIAHNLDGQECSTVYLSYMINNLIGELQLLRREQNKPQKSKVK